MFNFPKFAITDKCLLVHIGSVNSLKTVASECCEVKLPDRVAIN